MSIETPPIATMASRFVNSTHRHIFLTGKAGTGKTTFLRQITQTTHKNAMVAAPTGIAAINAGGVTLHSLFHLPFGTFVPSPTVLPQQMDFAVNTPQTLLNSLKMHTAKRNLLKRLELLIIDEVSMLRADVLDAIDVILRAVRRQKELSFGGVQILFIGDLLQLPPIVPENEQKILADIYQSLYFFNAKAIEKDPPVYIELDKIYRQSDPHFVRLLNHLRENHLSGTEIDFLNRFYRPDFRSGLEDGYIFLTTHNAIADRINQTRLKELNAPAYRFKAEIDGDFPPHLYPLDETLVFKKGAQVMFIKNDYSGEQRYYNGKIGRISRLSDGMISVKLEEGNVIQVDPYIWENKTYTLDHTTQEIKEKILGTFSQYPLKTAWAVTIHKSQGLTFDKAVIDVARAFAPGQIYVALSRLTSLKGLVLAAPIPLKKFSPDPNLSAFHCKKKPYRTLEREIESDVGAYTRSTVLAAFNFQGLLQTMVQHINSYNKDEKRSAKQRHRRWAVALLKETQPLKEVGDKFLRQIERITADASSRHLPFLHQRLGAAKKYYDPLLQGLAEKIMRHSGELKGQKGVKSYRRELLDLKQACLRQLKEIYKAEAIVEASVNKRPFSKENLTKIHRHITSAGDISSHSSPQTTPPDTKTMSFNLLKKGKSIVEIAKERKLAVSTIEGHMAHFIKEGQLDIRVFLKETDVKKILSAAAKQDNNSLSELKATLKDKYSYGELKMALAYRHYLDS